MAEARETKGPGERPRARQRGIALDIAPARRDRAGARGQALQQGGLAAAVLPHQERDGGPEVEALEVAEERQRERKRRGLPPRAGAADAGQEESGPRRGLAGARPLHADRLAPPGRLAELRDDPERSLAAGH